RAGTSASVSQRSRTRPASRVGRRSPSSNKASVIRLLSRFSLENGKALEHWGPGYASTQTRPRSPERPQQRFVRVVSRIGRPWRHAAPPTPTPAGVRCRGGSAVSPERDHQPHHQQGTTEDRQGGACRVEQSDRPVDKGPPSGYTALAKDRGDEHSEDEQIRP